MFILLRECRLCDQLYTKSLLAKNPFNDFNLSSLFATAA